MSSLTGEMGFGARTRRRVGPIAFVAALGLHGAVAMAMGSHRARAAAPIAATEIELGEAPPEAPPPPEPPPSPEPPAPEQPVEQKVGSPAPASGPKVVAPSPPAAAKAGALLAAKDDAPTPGEEPVSFVTDPNGSSYGSGVVAKGGTAEVAIKGASPSGSGAAPPPAAKAASPAPADAIVAAADLSKSPALAESDPCKGLFPSAADDDAGVVSLVVVVRASGAVASVSIASESPKGQGFGAAARGCLLGKHFAPGLDKAGYAVTATAKVTVRFSR